MRKSVLTLGIVVLSTAVGAALAQSVDGLDLKAIQARADAHAEDAAILSAEVQRRTEEHREDAETLRAVATEQLRELGGAQLANGAAAQASSAGPVDFDEIVAAASGNMADNRGSAPQFMVFVSLSMPEASLRQVIRDTSAAGGFVVFRGFPNNSAKQFLAGVSKVVAKDDSFASIGIDPRLFRAFDVQAVPTFVAVSSDFSPCDGLACTTTPPPYSALSGNVSVSYALETFAGENGPGALVARTALRNLGRAP